jgi:NADPH2:quinone reductase
MKAIVCEKFAAVEELSYQDVDDPVAGKGQVLVDVAAIGVNYPDGLLVQGLYQMKPPFPFIPGMEVAGVISALGDGVTQLRVGQRVVGLPGLNAYAEKVVIQADAVMPLPDSIADEEAAGLITAHATAHHALKQRAQLQAGELLVVIGAAGGTGLAAVQIGKAMGATVVAVCSTQEKLDIAKANGADILINYSESDLKTELKKLNDGKGVDVVYDVVGGDAFDACSRSMAWKGRLLVVGFASGKIPQLPVNLTLVKGYSVVGVFWGSFTQFEPQAFRENMIELMDWYVEGRIKVLVDEVFPLQDTAKALHKVMDRKVKGKVILKP